MSEQVKVAVVYYSSTGTVYELAKSIVEGAASDESSWVTGRNFCIDGGVTAGYR